MELYAWAERDVAFAALRSAWKTSCAAIRETGSCEVVVVASRALVVGCAGGI